MTRQIFINMVKVQKDQKISEGLHESRSKDVIEVHEVRRFQDCPRVPNGS